MQELHPHQFSSTRPLFAALSEHLAIPAVLEGRAAGRVFVNSADRPQAGLLWAGNRVFLAGKRERAVELRQLFGSVIIPELQARGSEAFMLYFSPASWEAALPGLLPGARLILARRAYFARPAAPLPVRPALPDGFALLPVTAGLLARRDLKGLDWLMEEMCSERPSVEDFLAHSFGVCLEYAGEIVGWCLSEYNCAAGCEIGIATAEAFQRQGLATQMTLAFVEQAQQLGLPRLGWDCFAENLPSVATARKTGFEQVLEYNSEIVVFNQKQTK